LVAKRWGKVADEAGNLRGLEKLTKGEAANIITRLKHGAKVRNTQCHQFYGI
jgi:ATP-dependent helicase IRC3